MFDIRYSKQAVNFLKSAEKKLITRILKKIETLKENPIQHDSKVVEGYNEKLFRIMEITEYYMRLIIRKINWVLLRLTSDQKFIDLKS